MKITEEKLYFTVSLPIFCFLYISPSLSKMSYLFLLVSHVVSFYLVHIKMHQGLNLSSNHKESRGESSSGKGFVTQALEYEFSPQY